MRIAIIGQQDFGKAVLEAFLARKDEVAGVFCAPEKPGAKADPLRAAAEERGLKVFQFKSLREREAHEALTGLRADLGVMAYVLQFAPDSLVRIPRLGTIHLVLLSHMHGDHVGDLKLKAQEAGCDMVLPRSAFSQNLPQLLRRHGAAEEA